MLYTTCPVCGYPKAEIVKADEWSATVWCPKCQKAYVVPKPR